MAPACSCRCRLYARVKGNLIAVLAKAHRPPFFPSGIRLQTSSLLKGLQEGSFRRPLCCHSHSPPSPPPTDAMGGQQGPEMEMGSGSLGTSVASGGSKSPHGLKFGKKLYFEGAGGGDPGPDATAVAPKRRKGVVQGRQPPTPPRCQVEGCRVDLTGSKTYYCRHKVCGMHSKAPTVIIAGLEQRFCQQCSRFHQLAEFDQGKRSCRRRLAGHNERRRKPPPGSLPSHFGQLPSSFHEDNGRYGGFLVNFSHPRLSEAARDVWPTVREDDRGRGASSRNQDGLYTLSSGFAANMTQSYMQGSPGGSIFAAPKIPPGSSFGVSDSSCALSLLSTQPRGATATTRNQAPTILGSNYEGSPLAQPGASAGFTRSTWSFHETSSSMLEIPREVDLGQASEQCDGHFSGELELALQGNKQCIDPGHGRVYRPGNPMH